MMQGLGIDAIEIERFAYWHTYKPQQLLKIFSPEELQYAQQNPLKQPERLAVRFAAKEAFYKALCSRYKDLSFSLLFICQNVEVKLVNQIPKLQVNWSVLQQKGKFSFKASPLTLLSLTHTKTTAMAVVILL